MNFLSKALLLSTLVATTRASDDICDAVGASCNVIENEPFANSDSLLVTLPAATSTVVDTVVYQYVYHWVPENGHSLIHSFDVYSIGTPVVCGELKLGIATGAGTRVLTGFTAETRGSLNVCVADINEVFDRDLLLAADEVYLLFRNIGPVMGDSIFIDRNYDVDVRPLPDVVYYNYDLNNTSLDTYTQGTEISLTIHQHVYNEKDISTCKTMDNTMNTIQLSGTDPACTLTRTSTTVVDNGKVYTYEMSKLAYELCKSGSTSVGGDVTYATTITLNQATPLVDGDGAPCVLFRSGLGEDTQELEITLAVDGITDSDTIGDAEVATVQVTNFAIERCDVFAYLVPSHYSLFTLDFVYAGDTMTFDDINSVYLDAVSDFFTVESGPTTVSLTNGKKTTYVIKSAECRPTLVNDDGDCVLEQTSLNTIKNMVMNVADGAETNQVTFLEIPTAMENARFAASSCSQPTDHTIQELTDNYVGVATLRNLPNPDFSTVPGEGVKFYEPLIVQLELQDVGGALAESDLQIQSVAVSVEDPSNPGTTLAYKMFNKGDKKTLLGYDWTSYYNDAHFCRDEDGAGTCSAFVDVVANQNAFTNAWTAMEEASICQTGSDTSIKDYFTFNADQWFTSIQLPLLSVKVDVTAVISDCSTALNRRRLQSRTINYVAYAGRDNAIQTVLYTGATQAPTTQPPAVSSTEVSSDISIIVGGVSGGLVFTGGILWYFVAKKRKVVNKNNYYSRV